MLESLYKIFVPSGLILLMFGMGMQLVPTDFSRVIRYPRAVIMGLTGQFLLLPLVAFALILAMSLPLAVAAGVLILAVCPGGIVSNSIVFLARADISLSVTLTAISSILALATIPLLLDLGLDFVQQHHGVEVGGAYVELPLMATVKQLLMLVFVPLVAGMLVRHYFSNFAIRSEGLVRILGVLVLLVLLAGSVALEFSFFVENLSTLWPVLLLFNLATLFGGYLLATAAGLPQIQGITLALEVGVQNVALGAMIALNILQRPEWTVVPTTYSVVSMATAFLLILYGIRIAQR